MAVSCDTPARVLIADDQPDLLEALRLLLKGEGIEIEAVTSPEAALCGVSRRGAFDLVLMDLNYTGDTTSGREGIDLLARVQALDTLLPVVVHDRLGQRRIWRSKRCAAASATSSRSPGTTRSWWRRCGTKIDEGRMRRRADAA